MKKKSWVLALSILLVLFILFFVNSVFNRSEVKKIPTANIDHAADAVVHFASEKVNESPKVFLDKSSKLQRVMVAKSQVEISEDQASLECHNKLLAQTKGYDFYNQNKDYFHQMAGDWFFSNEDVNLPANEKSKQGKFFLALAYAGVLDGRFNGGDLNHALELLNEVRTMDPDNAAPLLYAAMIEKDRGNLEEAENLLRKAKELKRTDTYLTDIAQFIYARVQTSADYIQAISVWWERPIPAYAELRNFLKGQDAKQFADQMMAKSLDTKNILEDVEWSTLDYAYGVAILKDSQDPRIFLSRSKFYEKRASVTLKKLNSYLLKNCELSQLKPVVDFYKSRVGLSKVQLGF